MRSRRRKSGVIIPWERHGLVLDLLRGAWLGKAVAAILLVLAGVWIYRHTDERARVRETRAAIGDVSRAVQLFRADRGRCPHNLAELTRPTTAGTPHLLAVPKDGWGRALDLICPGRQSPDVAEVRSRGPDGTWFGMDEID